MIYFKIINWWILNANIFVSGYFKNSMDLQATLSSEYLINNKPFHEPIAFKRSAFTFHVQTIFEISCTKIKSVQSSLYINF